MPNPKPGPRRCIWCENEKFFHPNRKRSEFNREDVLLCCFGTFKDDLTLLESVCKACNQKFGDDVDRNFGRGGHECYDRFKYGDKAATTLGQFDQTSLPMQAFVPYSPTLHGASITLIENGNKVVEDFEPQVGFEREDGTYLRITEAELDKISSVRELKLPVPTRISFYCAPPDVVERLVQKLRDRHCELGEMYQEPTPSSIPILALCTLDIPRQRCIVKMSIDYLAKICEKSYPEFLFNEQLTKAKSFAYKGDDPGYGIVALSQPIAAVNRTTGKSLGHGHAMAIGFYDYRGKNQLVCQICLYGRTTYAIHLCLGFKGPIIPLKRADFWDLSNHRRYEVQLIDVYQHAIC